MNDKGKEKYFDIRFFKMIGKTNTIVYINIKTYTNIPFPKNLKASLTSHKRKVTNRIPPQINISTIVKNILQMRFCLFITPLLSTAFDVLSIKISKQFRCHLVGKASSHPSRQSKSISFSIKSL